MRILSVAYPFAPVAPWTAGGAEQVLLGLDRVLVQQGHESVVIAAAGSEVAGRLVELPPVPQQIDDEARARTWQYVREALDCAMSRQRFDAVHMHGIDFHQYLPENPTRPVLVTLHLPLSWYPPEALRLRPNVWLHCVSDAQHAGAATHAQFLPPIPNGVNLPSFWPKRRKHRYLVVASRICPEKATHIAMDAAAAAGLPLIVAGDVFPYETHQQYFEKQVKPRPGYLVGSVGGARKRRLFAGAAALLAPTQAPETSSLVAMEALASATPVIAFPSGALSTMIEHGRTGFLVRSTEEMTEAIHRLPEIDPQACREHAEQHFDFQRTAAAYLRVYEEIARA